MSIEELIKQSEWWHEAQQVLDRHYDPSEGVTLADHLEAVNSHLDFLSCESSSNNFVNQLNQALLSADLDSSMVKEILGPVALLHDIGKTREDKSSEGPHPITGEMVKLRHPVIGVEAAMELLPEELATRDTIIALVEEHDTPFSWYTQCQKSGQIPKRRSWARLDRKIDGRENGAGIMLLAVFKLADIDGHAEVDDVHWFFEQAVNHYLREKGKWLPLPDESTIRSLNC